MTRFLKAALAVTLLVSSHAGAQDAPNAPAGAIPPPEAAATAAPLPAPIAATPLAPTAPAPKGPVLFGYVNLQYARTDPPGAANPSSTFQARRARIGARGDLTPNVGYTLLFDATDTSLKDAYGVLKGFGIPGLELRAGQWKTPFGYEQPESDTKLLWVNGSYVVQALARSTSTASVNATPDSRDLGAGVVGKWGGGIGAELAASVVNGAGPNRTDDLDTKNFWGRAGLVWKAGAVSVRAGGSYGYGRQVAGLGADGKLDGATPKDDTYFWFSTYGGDAEVDTPLFFAAAEVIQSERRLRTFTSATASTASNFTSRGWYAAIYGKTPWNAGPIFRAERYDRSRTVQDDTNERYTLGAYVDVLPVNARLIFNYELDRSARPVRSGDRAILFGQVMF